jgi:hypothetical protein
MTKALIAEGDYTMPSARWIVSRRGTLKVFSDRLECGDWSIPYDEIEESVLHSGAGLLFPGYVLKVTTQNKTYQFGLNPGGFWKGELPFPVRRTSRSRGQTLFVYTVRTVVMVVLAYWLWAKYHG